MTANTIEICFPILEALHNLDYDTLSSVGAKEIERRSQLKRNLELMASLTGQGEAWRHPVECYNPRYKSILSAFCHAIDSRQEVDSVHVSVTGKTLTAGQDLINSIDDTFDDLLP